MIHLIKTEIKMKSSIKVYSQRGGRLVWLTHKDQLVEHGFEPGSRFNVEFTEDKIIITSAVDGSRKVSDKKGKPASEGKWHWPMLSDRERSGAYARAIDQAVRRARADAQRLRHILPPERGTEADRRFERGFAHRFAASTNE